MVYLQEDPLYILYLNYLRGLKIHLTPEPHFWGRTWSSSWRSGGDWSYSTIPPTTSRSSASRTSTRTCALVLSEPQVGSVGESVRGSVGVRCGTQYEWATSAPRATSALLHRMADCQSSVILSPSHACLFSPGKQARSPYIFIDTRSDTASIL